jgi:hypothetical protein
MPVSAVGRVTVETVEVDDVEVDDVDGELVGDSEVAMDVSSPSDEGDDGSEGEHAPISHIHDTATIHHPQGQHRTARLAERREQDQPGPYDRDR